MSHWLARLITLGAAIALLPWTASAQNVLAQPTYGTVNLSAGFRPDPHASSVTAGGADYVTRGGCSAYIHAAAPDLDLNYQAGRLPLTIAVRSETDVVLLVNLPDGSWRCDDDSGGGTDALLTFSSPQSGNYNLWVGTYRPRTGTSAQVYISELGDTGSGGRAAATRLNWRADPAYGTVNLSAGFTPDPHTRTIAAGGPDAVPDLGPECSGYVNASAPDLDLDYTAGNRPLHIYARSQVDITLIVNLPDGSWVCSDDAHGTNPHILLPRPQSGNYNIWIGTYRASASPLPQSTLHISERAPRW